MQHQFDIAGFMADPVGKVAKATATLRAPKEHNK
jgi:hypothetical protein